MSMEDPFFVVKGLCSVIVALSVQSGSLVRTNTPAWTATAERQLSVHRGAAGSAAVQTCLTVCPHPQGLWTHLDFSITLELDFEEPLDVLFLLSGTETTRWA
ncbi:hypothetical protein INR49_010023, partial [Caranx melampygus]